MEQDTLMNIGQLAVAGVVSGTVRHVMTEARSPEIFKLAVAGGELLTVSTLVAFNPGLAPMFWGVLIGYGSEMAFSRR